MSMKPTKRNAAGLMLHNASPHRTVCEVLRAINDIHQGDEQEDLTTRALVREAVDMAKRMDLKLKEYSKQYDRDWWEDNPDYEADLERRMSVDYLALDEAGVSELVLKIPSMGGREIGKYLRQWASEVRPGHGIVELGVWLGAGTAQMALGVRESGNGVLVRGYDRFSALQSEVRKAADHGVTLIPGMDTRPVISRLLAPLEIQDHCTLTRGVIPPESYDGPPIGLHVDDACKRAGRFLAALRTFGPHWVAGETIVVLMDYWYFERRSKDPGLQFQHDWMRAETSSFKVIAERMPGTSAAAFCYLGGEPWKR